MRTVWRTEGLRTAGALIVGSVLGYLLGATGFGLAAAALALLFWHMRNAQTLVDWLQAPKNTDLPDGEGIWAEVFTGSYERHRRYRKRKKRLARMLHEFRASTAALPDAAIVLDANGSISWYNQAAMSLLGLQGQRDMGQRINNLIRHPEFQSYFSAGSTRSQNGVEIPAPLSPQTTLWIRVIPYGRNQHLLIARDVSAFKLLEQTRRDFVANASHELRTPLTVVRGYLDMMGEEADKPEAPLGRWLAPLTEMRQQSARMQQIISDLLKLAKLESGGLQKHQDVIDMQALLDASLEEAETISDGAHQLSLESDASLCLYGRQAELQSVIGNLLTNALRYTPEGGSVKLIWRAHEDGAELAVEDSGIGVDAADLPRLTERFYRADVARSRASGGTGLGLAIVKHALERHDGRLEIESTPGKGSRFSCRFPQSRVHSRDSQKMAI